MGAKWAAGFAAVVTVLLVSLRGIGVAGQSTAFDNWVGMGGATNYGYSLTLSKGGELVGSLTIPRQTQLVVAFKNSQPHSHDPDGNRFEFHGDFEVYPEPVSHAYQGRFHPDKNAWQWASE